MKDYNLTPVDRYLTTRLFNERKSEYPTGLMIHELFEAQVNESPTGTAVVYEDDKLSYSELNKRANQLAHYLINLGVKKGDLVGVSLKRSVDMIVSVIAVLKAGAAYLPIEPSFPQKLVEFMIEDSSLTVIVTMSNVASNFETSQVKKIILDNDQDLISKMQIDKPDVEVLESDIAYAIYTSGSTGKRKAALIEHKSIVNQYFAWKDVYQLCKQGGILQTASFSFDVFTGDWVRALCSGIKLVLNPFNLILSPSDLKTGKYLYLLMKDNGVTCAEFTPPVLRKLLRYVKDSNKSLDFLDIVIVGADAWYINEHKEFIEYTKGQVRLINSYGMTEATVDSTYYEEYGNVGGKEISLIGRPFMNTEVYILDDDNSFLPVGETGELCVAGPGLARGYLNRPKLNKERFVKIALPDNTYRRIYKSGDLARFRFDGTLEFQGRKDNQIEIGAIRVELGEIEAAIQRYDAIQENVVVIREVENRDNTAICFIVTKQGKEVNIDELKTFLQQLIPEYMIPSEFHIIETMPLTQSNKIDRTNLAERVK